MLDPLMAIMVQVCVCAARGARRAAFKCQGKVPGCVSVRGCACVCAGDMVPRHPTPRCEGYACPLTDCDKAGVGGGCTGPGERRRRPARPAWPKMYRPVKRRGAALRWPGKLPKLRLFGAAPDLSDSAIADASPGFSPSYSFSLCVHVTEDAMDRRCSLSRWRRLKSGWRTCFR